MRNVFVLLHRYLGLTMALFLIVAGLTGSIMAFEDEIDAWLNPQLFQVSSRGQELSPTQLADRIEQQDSRLSVSYVPIVLAEGQSVRVGVQAHDDPVTGEPHLLGFNQLFADPIAGTVLGTRQTGTMQFDRVHFIPFVVKLHYSLFLPGSWGIWLFGIVALLWTADCFIGLYLTFPRGRPFMNKWRPAWQLKRKRFNFDLHRAGGLWAWIVLLILAISSVSLNLYSEVFKPVVSWFSPITPTPFDSRVPRGNPLAPAFDYDQALALARIAGMERGFTKPVGAIGYRPERGFYFATYKNTDGRTESGLSNGRLYFDDQTGAVIGERGTDNGTAGDFFAQLQYPLHSGRIAGVAGRAFICLMGLLVAVLTVTGIIIWLRKRHARAVSHARHAVTGAVRAGRTDSDANIPTGNPVGA